MGIFVKALIGALVVVLIGVNAIVGYQNLKTLAGDYAWVTQSHEVLHGTDALLLAVFACETAARGYVLTGDEAYAARYEPLFKEQAATQHDSVLETRGVPVSWDVEKNQNVGWRTAIPGLAHSSPIVWGDRIYLTSAISADPKSVFQYPLAGQLDRHHLGLAVMLVPGIVGGFLVSKHLARVLDKGRTRAAVLVVSGLSALSVLVDALVSSR